MNKSSSAVSSRVSIKVCGITNLADAQLCVSLGVDAIGFNFVASSPRHIDIPTAREIIQRFRGQIHTVAVTADLPLNQLLELKGATGVECFQLHGDEPPLLLFSLLPQAYKAVRIGDAADVERALAFPGEYLLVDAKVAGQLGGTGHNVDWGLVEPLARTRKLTLAGGLRPDNVAQAIRAVRPYAVDVASGVERDRAPRSKDPAKVAAFCQAVRDVGEP